MVKYFDTSYIYDYSFPAVALAYFLRYPNPYSTHVLSSDVLSRTVDADTGRLTTTRLHLKRSRLPPAIVKILPQSALGNVSAGSSSSYILETSTIDIKEGWMETESRNLDWTGILSVVEKQIYKRDCGALTPQEMQKTEDVNEGTTSVATSVKFRSRLGERLRARARRGEDGTAVAAQEDPEETNKGLLSSWTTGSLQRSVEAIASRRTSVSQGNSKQGMTVVLERLRNGGLMAVLEGMRQDRELMFAQHGTWARS